MGARRGGSRTLSNAKLDFIIDKRLGKTDVILTGVTAGDALSGGGSRGTVTLNVDIDDASDGSRITVADDDLILVADADNSNAVKKVTVSQLPVTPEPAGSSTYLQFNNGGSFGAAANLNYNNSSTDPILSMTGSFQLTGSLGINVRGREVTHGLTLPNETSDNSGMVKATAYLSYSSKDLKENIKDLENPLDKLGDLRGVRFSWKDSGKKDIGFIADEVGKVLPELVYFESSKAVAMDYSKMTCFLLECVKKQQDQISLQNKQINDLKTLLQDATLESNR